MLKIQHAKELIGWKDRPSDWSIERADGARPGADKHISLTRPVGHAGPPDFELRTAGFIYDSALQKRTNVIAAKRVFTWLLALLQTQNSARLVLYQRTYTFARLFQ